MVSSTLLAGGIEIVLPGLYKAYPRAWAEEFLHDGTVYFTNLAVFREQECPLRGDPMEGTSVTIRESVKCTASYINPIFVWCCTMETEPEVILSTWNDRDSVVEVTDPVAFAERVKDAAVACKAGLLGLQIGPVTYDKDRGSHHAYAWGEGIFQKNLHFNGQKEFRFALVGDTRLQEEKNIILNVGECKDIARIVAGGENEAAG